MGTEGKGFVALLQKSGSKGNLPGNKEQVLVLRFLKNSIVCNPIMVSGCGGGGGRRGGGGRGERGRSVIFKEKMKHLHTQSRGVLRQHGIKMYVCMLQTLRGSQLQ